MSGNRAGSLTQAVHDAWNQNAEWWDETTGEGNLSQKTLIGPATERLLDLQPEELVLDCACGNGAFARRMAQLGARVVAFDFSERFLERAKARTVDHADRIEYRLIDATNESQLFTLGEGRFDAAVCTMALMDMATIEPLVGALSRLLKAGGRFVFSATHPCFNNPSGATRIIEEEDRDGELITTYSVKVFRYMRAPTARGLGIVGQPAPHYYFSRPISVLFNTCFRAGFVLDGLEELAFDEPVTPNRPFSWVNYSEIPPFLVARMRVAAQAEICAPDQ